MFDSNFLYVQKGHFLTFIVPFCFCFCLFCFYFHFYPNTDSRTIFVQLYFMLNGLEAGEPTMRNKISHVSMFQRKEKRNQHSLLHIVSHFDSYDLFSVYFVLFFTFIVHLFVVHRLQFAPAQLIHNKLNVWFACFC